ncbi:MAG TPA: TonB-dependent receptor plug domain-containing protein, partial [Agriterribacter sp.]|nr:TonB-dependent receptor plug domain-containing protein [Agriterribacter sp.]
MQKFVYGYRIPWWRSCNLTKTLLVMKLTILFLTAACLNVYASGVSQTVTLSGKNVELKKVFTAIKKQTGYVVFYNRSDLNGTTPVSLSTHDMPLRDFLDVMLKDQPLDYKIEDRTIMLYRKVVFEKKMRISEPVTEVIASIIRGKVTNAKEEPLQNVSVIEVGSQAGTTTNNEGQFTLTVPDNKNIVLEFSSVGYQTKRVNTGNKTEVNIILELEVAGLSDIVVVGYGTQRKVNLTGAVSSVDAKQIENRAASDISAVLTGQAPGLTVVQGGGNPGRNTGVLNIRGIGSFNSTDPLIIVDGIPTGSITDINPQDVANVSVLKDAASASIYGVRAANGVILITTKRGTRNNKPKTNFSHQTGCTQYLRLPKKANAVELANLHNQANDNDGTPRLFTDEDIRKFGDGSSPLTHANIDLINLLFSKGLWNSDNLSVSGGSERGTYNVSLGHIYEGGIINQTGLKKYTLRTNLDYKAISKL